MTRSDSELVRVRSSVLNAHRADRVDPADIQRAYLRFSWARRKAPPRLPGLRWLVAGVAIGLGVASAATLVPKLITRPAVPLESAKVSAGVATPHAIRRAARSSEITAAPSLSVAIPTPSAQPLAPLPPSAAVVTPSAAAQRLPAPAKAELAASASASDWQRAAVALRDGDLSAAEAALAKLEKSDSVLDRQAAELARAQLLVRRGRGAEAKRTLQRLAREGGSEVIRSQAGSTLQTLGD